KEAIKIKRVTDDQIVSSAYMLGDSISQALKDTIQAAANDLCNLPDLTTYLANDQLQELISQASIRCHQEQITHPKEVEIWEAYQAGFIQKSPLQAGIQRLGDKNNYKELVFTVPLTYTEGESNKLAVLSITLKKSAIIMTF
ncbi:MAG: hypothetical protein ACPGJS_22705, partial [Flammeovirgaceae bacterium]